MRWVMIGLAFHRERASITSFWQTRSRLSPPFYVKSSVMKQRGTTVSGPLRFNARLHPFQNGNLSGPLLGSVRNAVAGYRWVQPCWCGRQRCILHALVSGPGPDRMPVSPPGIGERKAIAPLASRSVRPCGVPRA
jgi:hypothetical protein